MEDLELFPTNGAESIQTENLERILFAEYLGIPEPRKDGYVKC